MTHPSCGIQLINLRTVVVPAAVKADLFVKWDGNEGATLMMVGSKEN